VVAYAVEGPLPILPRFREPRSYCAYIMGSLSGTLYVGVSGNLHKRVFEHKFHRIEGFTHRYNVTRLLYWESFGDVHKAIAREKQLKGWRRSKKIALICLRNPHWVDLARAWYPWMESGSDRGASTADGLRYAKPIPRSA
jgi:putative endonuclease